MENIGFIDIDKRYMDIQERIEPQHVRAHSNTKKIQERLKKETQVTYFLSTQGRIMMYLLGFEDNHHSMGPSGVSSETYNRKIDLIAPKSEIISLKPRKHPWRGQAISEKGLETVFEELGRKGELNYSKERFIYSQKFV